MIRLTEEVYAYFFLLQRDYALTSGPIFTEIQCTAQKTQLGHEVGLRFCPWVLLLKYYTGGRDPTSSFSLHYVYLW
jgi:hypothetical protein